jgi:hypothetical protein
MKTPLPAKVSHPDCTAEEAINDIITYLAELTEVVEGKQTGYADFEKPYMMPETPTLKEMLLTEIAHLQIEPHMIDGEMDLSPADRVHNSALTKVEAIINRLIP